ncbi:MAG: tetratricopeptide repeat protein 38 family protein [Sneathiella sp.]|uniref:tetratricopeptide repeat protein n=1 Tax=Sneathiella sp. TaxID=1964365 RepID=UPI000C53EE40|nr:tetratricopeptide repeat protein [Sneathiella sp.]MAZ03601.1 tetratricopeptide repeat protein 38 family protein [Sneathiella sp.]
MHEDMFGNPVRTQSDQTLDAINRFMDSYIGFGTDFAPIFEAADNDPECTLAAGYAALLGLMLETPDRLEIAGKYQTQAEANLNRGTERERLFVASVGDLLNNRIGDQLVKLRQLVSEFPGDLFAAKLAQNSYFNIGDDHTMLWIADQVIERHKDCAYVYGMRAFGREQTSQLDLAEEDGRRATEMKRKEPWAHHAVAHVMLTQGRHDEGIKWMQELSDEWEDRNSFMLTHNWWHQSLFFLEQEDFRTPLEIYDERVWGVDKTYSLDQVNAISLLWRLEQLGVDVGDRWSDVSDYVANRYLINDQPFFDMHYGYALARGHQQEALEKLTIGMEKMATDAPDVTRKAWAEVALPATRGFIAIADGNYKEAAGLLSAVRPRFQEIGGSHAQRDLFELAWLTSLLNAREYDAALPHIEARVAFRHDVAMDARLLARARQRN